MSWTIDDSKVIHGVGSGDLDFLDINTNGQLEVIIEGKHIAIPKILSMLRDDFNLKENQKIPSFTLRLPQLIKHQISKILNAFDTSFSEHKYLGKFKPLYPIKVNQRKSEIITVLESSPRYGLEAGTKAELFLILKQLIEQKDRLVVCNGVKDKEYIEIINEAIKERYTVFVSIESVNELRLCMEKIDIDKLNLIFRIKPYVPVEGYWGSTSGRNSKFGLSIKDLADVIDILAESNHKDLLKGIHAHPGSQISDFNSLARYIDFLVDTYQQLHNKGFDNLSVLNFGGGMPIRYEAENNEEYISNYARKIVESISNMCQSESIPHPDIMIESGRYVTASSSMAVVQILDFLHLFPHNSEVQQKLREKISNINSLDEAENLWKQHEADNYASSKFENMLQYETEHGIMKTELRKRLGLLYHDKFLNSNILKPIHKSNFILLGNFSVFNSVCDHVMVGQYFPVFEIENLDIQPDTLVRLVDITCDSDGEMSIFKTKQVDKKLLTTDGFPLTTEQPHYFKGFPISLKTDPKSKYLVIPLAGAYQDIIELDHNLIGDLPDVRLELRLDEKWSVEVTTHAQPIYDLLKRVGYHLEIDRTSYIT